MVLSFGTRSQPQRLESLRLSCPSCHGETAGSLVRAWRFLHVLTMPVLPLGVYGVFLRCDRCDNLYRTPLASSEGAHASL
jgi:hypothetical protein